jgi:hypothetical protein
MHTRHAKVIVTTVCLPLANSASQCFITSKRTARIYTLIILFKAARIYTLIILFKASSVTLYRLLLLVLLYIDH